MLTAYLRAAMNRAKYEILQDSGRYYGEIPDFPGVWADADTLEKCREELEEVLEEWVLLGVARSHPLPEIDGLVLRIQEAS